MSKIRRGESPLGGPPIGLYKSDFPYTKSDCHLNSPHADTCDNCDGSGKEPMHYYENCHKCGGTGKIIEKPK